MDTNTTQGGVMEAPQDLITVAKWMAVHPAHGNEIHVVFCKRDGVLGVHSTEFIQQRGPENFTVLHTERRAG
jgi:hypothetical protein